MITLNLPWGASKEHSALTRTLQIEHEAETGPGLDSISNNSGTWNCSVVSPASELFPQKLNWCLKSNTVSCPCVVHACYSLRSRETHTHKKMNRWIQPQPVLLVTLGLYPWPIPSTLQTPVSHYPMAQTTEQASVRTAEHWRGNLSFPAGKRAFRAWVWNPLCENSELKCLFHLHLLKRSVNRHLAQVYLENAFRLEYLQH